MKVDYSGKHSATLSKADKKAIETLLTDQHPNLTQSPELEVKSGDMTVLFSFIRKGDTVRANIHGLRETVPGNRASNAKKGAAAEKTCTDWKRARMHVLIAELDKRKIDHTKASNNALRAQLLIEDDQKKAA